MFCEGVGGGGGELGDLYGVGYGRFIIGCKLSLLTKKIMSWNSTHFTPEFYQIYALFSADVMILCTILKLFQ